MNSNNSRRNFVRALAAGGFAYAMGKTTGFSFAQMGGSTAKLNDFKALVCVFLYGGNDSWNMVVPTSTAEYDHYYASRGGGTPSSLALEKSSLLEITRGDWAASNLRYGFHPSMSGLRQLFNEGRAAVVPNVGPMIKPLTKQQFQETPPDSRDIPPQLFSHFDQVEQWATLRGRALLKTGWAGRISDVMANDIGNQPIPVNVSLYGQSLFQTPGNSDQYVMGEGGVEFPAGLGVIDDQQERRSVVLTQLNEVLQSASGTYYERGYARVQKRAINYAETIGGALSKAPEIRAFSNPEQITSLWVQLRTVAKMIAQRSTLNMSRQIFFVGLGGFDSHDRQLADHPRLLGDLSRSVKAFHDAMLELGVAEQVTLFTQSDFGRTLTSNGDGSDHGWGGAQFVLGGSVRGGKFYGEYPSLAIDGPLTLPFGGVVVPTVAADQYAATLARWFGVPHSSLPAVAPNLPNFSQWDLGFMAS